MTTPPSTRLLAGRYRSGELLGRGGMAEVHDGWDERLHRPVAIKRLRPEMAARPDVRSRFEVEGRAAARLSHPNVVAVFDTGDDEGAPFLIMERLPGENLADRMASGPLPPADVARFGLEVLSALGAAHVAGIVHRDVKPANILLTTDGSAKVADFGIAKSAEVMAGDPTTAGMVLGTPAYLAPERVGGLPATAQSDLYALGVVLYEALTGVKPFQGATPLAMAIAIQTETPPPLAVVRPDVEPALSAAVDAAMSRDPADRPPTAAAMALILQGTHDQPANPVDVTAAMVPSAVPQAGSRRVAATRRHGPPWWPVAAGVAILAALLLAAASFGGGNGGGGAATDDASQAAALQALAGRAEVGDGAKGPEAASRLRALADQVSAGGGADAARDLAADATVWNAAGDLSAAATADIVSLLGTLVGVGPVAPVTSVAPPATMAPTTAVVEPTDPGRGERRGNGGKGHDDD